MSEQNKKHHRTLAEHNKELRQEDSEKVGKLGVAIGGLLLAGSVAAPFGALVAWTHHGEKEDAKDKVLQIEMAKQLHEDGVQIRLNDDRIAILKELPFSDRQLKAAKSNRNSWTGDTYKNRGVAFDLYTEKTSGTGLFIGPGGVGFNPNGFAITETSKIDEISLGHVDKEKVDSRDISIFIGAAQEVSDMAAQFVYDEKEEDLELRIIYGDDSKNDGVRLVAVVDGIE